MQLHPRWRRLQTSATNLLDLILAGMDEPVGVGAGLADIGHLSRGAWSRSAR